MDGRTQFAEIIGRHHGLGRANSVVKYWDVRVPSWRICVDK